MQRGSAVCSLVARSGLPPRYAAARDFGAASGSGRRRIGLAAIAWAASFAAVAALRTKMGEDAFARWQRSMDLAQRPRLLTGMEQAVLRQAVAPLLADLAASGMSLPDIRGEAHEERRAASVCGWIHGPGRTGQGIWVLLDSRPAEQVVQLAGQIQRSAADQLAGAGRSPEWPACPGHSGSPHRLEPEVRDGVAVWACRGKRPGDLAHRRAADVRRCLWGQETTPPAVNPGLVPGAGARSCSWAGA